jgi:H+/Cl- antiporter ClcA
VPWWQWALIVVLVVVLVGGVVWGACSVYSTAPTMDGRSVDEIVARVKRERRSQGRT